MHDYLIILRNGCQCRAYHIGVSIDDAQGKKALRLAAFRTLLWELTEEGRPQEYSQWSLAEERKSETAPSRTAS